MELSVNRNTVRINVSVLDTTVEHPVECDVVLPDYCPDIARILSTDAGACINKKTIETDCLTTEGTFYVKIIYVPENSCSIRCFTYENDFSQSFEASGIEATDMIKVCSHVSYITCRQIGPRRLQIKSSVKIRAKAWRNNEQEIVSNCDDNRVEMLTKSISESTLVGICDKPFEVEQQLEIAYAKPPCATIIKTDAIATVKDYKVIKNKIITKGELILNTMYSPDISENALEVVTNAIPLSVIIDLDGVDEQSVCSINYTVSDIKIEASQDSDGENRLLNVDAMMIADAKAYKTDEITISEDAYSPIYEMQIDKKPITLDRICDVICSDEVVKLSVETPQEDITSVIDCVMKVDNYDEKLDGKDLTITGEMTALIMACDMQSSPVCFQKTMPFTIKITIPNKYESMRCDTDLNICAVSFSMSNNAVDIRCECKVSIVFFEVVNSSFISNMTLNEEEPKKFSQKTLTLYYADKSEKLWDIAKKYNTSMDAIMKENNCETSYVQDRSMLLIPKRHCLKNK